MFCKHILSQNYKINGHKYFSRIQKLGQPKTSGKHASKHEHHHTELEYPGLVRDFIRDRLYGSLDGYFQKDNHQVGILKEPIQFKKLLGYYAYRQELQKMYPENAWVTPSEVFKPFFGYMLANYMVDTCYKNNYKKLKIIEVGPDTGALAESIIEFLKLNNFDKKAQLEYHGVDISQKLCKTIESRFEKSYPDLLANGQLKIYNNSVFEYNLKDDGPGFVIGMEILDNMPHDRLYRESEESQAPWQYQTICKKIVTKTDQGQTEEIEEEIEPIEDGWGKLYLQLLKNMPEMDSITVK